jgi:TRAP-type C4-dicarboxylate transport system substrate-binding protein
MVRLTRSLVTLALVAAVAVAVGAQGAATSIKLGTLVPARSVWGNEIAQMGSEWKKLSGGRVDLTIYADGTQGDEDAVLRKMKFNQLQAAALTAIGLQRLDMAFNAFAVPLFYDSPQELFHVMDKMLPVMEQRTQAKGYELLSLSYGGWVQVFSTKPVTNLADLKGMKIFTSAGDAQMVQWYKERGFNPVPLATTDMLTALQTGQVEALPNTPIGVLTLQWYSKAPNMLDLGLAPFAGAQVLTKRAWEAIPADLRPAFKKAARDAELRLRAKVPDADAKAIAQMEQRGLKVSRLRGTPRQAEFEAMARQYADSMRGTWVPPDIFDLAIRERDAFRASRKAAK